MYEKCVNAKRFDPKDGDSRSIFPVRSNSEAERDFHDGDGVRTDVVVAHVVDDVPVTLPRSAVAL